MDKGHGRKEVRRLLSTTLLNDYLDGPDVGQMFELERQRECRGAESQRKPFLSCCTDHYLETALRFRRNAFCTNF